MGTLARVSVVFAVLGVLLLVFGTAGFSAMSADRGVDVSVVDDEAAYVGIETVGDETHDGNQVRLATITNQFATEMDPLTVDVAPGGGSGAIEDDTVKPDRESLGVGESVDVTAACTMTQKEGTVELEITGEAGGASFDLTRTVEIDCGPTTGTERVTLENVSTVDDGTGNLTIEFEGFGQAEFSDDVGGTYDVTVQFDDDETMDETVDLSDGHSKIDRDRGGQIVEITVGGESVENPLESGSSPGNGQGNSSESGSN